MDLGKFDEAIDNCRTALDIDPEYADAHYNLGILQLLRGDFQNGWGNYAWRWRMKIPPTPLRGFKQPIWDGRALEGKTLFVYSEQGLGDVIQFARYVPLMEARGGRVIFEVRESLIRLFEGSAIATNLVAAEQPPPAFDCHIPLLNLPQFFSTVLETIPCHDSYLRAPPELQAEWADRIASGDKIRLGIVWAGDAIHKNDRNRSIEASLFRPLLKIPGVSVYSLQVRRDGEAAKNFGEEVIDLAPFLGDFADTAAAMVELDLVVSADTSVVHLAGALGKPVWTLLPFIPDWRWLLERDDSPWYPTMRLFRQRTPGDWQAVMDNVCAALRERLANACD